MQYSKKLLTQSIVAKVAALIDKRAPHEELDRTWVVLLRLWNADDRSTPNPAPAGDTRCPSDHSVLLVAHAGRDIIVR